MKTIFYKLTFFTIAIFLLSAVNTPAQVKAWGSNFFGQLGTNGSANFEATPVNAGQPQTTGFCGGNYHTLFLRANGTVFGSGLNQDGQLGNGTINNASSTPVQATGITTATQVACGSVFSLALLADGTVKAWGRNNHGQLGDGTMNGSLSPLTVSGLSGIVAVEAGFDHAVALKSDGTVWAWGRGDDGELGNNSVADSSTPVQVMNLTGVVAVSAGSFYSIALKSDGTVWVWGYNFDGEIGNGTTTAHALLPTQSSITGVSKITAGKSHNAALKPDGTVWVWGANTSGQLGNGSAAGNVPTPTQNLTISGAIDVRSKGNTNYARLRNGSIQAWGENDNGETGSGNNTNPQATPVQALVGTGNPILGVGYNHAFISLPQATSGTGANQSIQGDSVRVTFSNVVGAGTTDYTAVDPTSTAVTNLILPNGYTIQANEPAYNFTTSVTPSGAVFTCLQLNGDYDPVVLNSLRILRSEGSILTDRTSTIDLRTRRICASASSVFSTFVIARGPGATAASVNISGRVLADGKGLANARVELTGTGGTPFVVMTNSFGNFTFNEVETGETYVVNVSAKKYTFAPQVVTVTDNISSLVFASQQ